VDPPTAVAWYGRRRAPDGTSSSTGCFHQALFTTAHNLREWVNAHPLETGQMVTIDQVLVD